MEPLLDCDPTDSRSRLIRAATKVFIEEGYRASVDRVATQACVARQTLYNHFPSKADLFGEVVRQVTEALLVTLIDDRQSLRERLLAFGVIYRKKLLSAEGLGFYRALVAETSRFPELAAAFYRSGPAQTTSRLAEILQCAIERNELRAVPALFAAKMLVSMLVGDDRSQCLFSGTPLPEPDIANTLPIIDCYLRAFAPEAAFQSTSESCTEKCSQ